jgi:hypothetical protein
MSDSASTKLRTVSMQQLKNTYGIDVANQIADIIRDDAHIPGPKFRLDFDMAAISSRFVSSTLKNEKCLILTPCHTSKDGTITLHEVPPHKAIQEGRNLRYIGQSANDMIKLKFLEIERAQRAAAQPNVQTRQYNKVSHQRSRTPVSRQLHNRQTKRDNGRSNNNKY